VRAREEAAATARHEAALTARDEAVATARDESVAAARDEALGAASGRRATLLGTAAALGALFGVGSSLAVLETIDDYPAAGGQAARYALAAALLALVLRRRRGPRPTLRQLGRLALLAASGLAGFNLLVIAAERSMDPASVGVVVATVPIVLAIAAPLQERRRIKPRVVLAAAIVALGAAAVQGIGGDVTVAGLAAAIGALLCEAAFSLVAAPLLPSLGAVGVSAWCAALAVPQLLLYGIVVDGPGGVLRAPALDEAAVLLYLGAVVTAGCFVLWYTAVRLLGVERAGLLTGAMPAGALLTGALLGHAALTAGRAAGVLAVAAGIAAGMRAARGGGAVARPRLDGGHVAAPAMANGGQ
jgi:drug/metabolite transporter (DMT)-like permease